MLRTNRGKGLIVLVLVFVMILSMVALAATDPFKVKLNLYERIVAMSLLPKEGNFLTLKIIRDLQMELAPTEEEAAIAELRTSPDGNGVVAQKGWFLVEEKEIILGEIAKGLIVDALVKLDEAEKLVNDHFSLYEKFVIGEKEGE